MKDSPATAAQAARRTSAHAVGRISGEARELPMINNSGLATPVALFVFNRPSTTEVVFEAIAAQRPNVLLLIADGPRPTRIGEAEQCARVRQIVTRVNWQCDVRTNFAAKNLGCRLRMASGLDWVFSEVERAIILEDDCVPDPSFFRFCEELLERYANDTRVMQLSGFNRLGTTGDRGASYLYSKFGPIWGWATWRRAWQSYDVQMKSWPAVRTDTHLALYDSRRERRWRLSVFDKTYRNEIDTWDYQWAFAKMINSGLSVIPHRSLVANIGFGPDATHTTEVREAPMPIFEMPFPLIHPQCIVRDHAFDAAYLRTVLPSIRARVSHRISRVASVGLRPLFR